MDARTAALGGLALVALASGAGLLVAGQLWGLDETIFVEGQPREVGEHGHVDPGLSRVGPNRTINVTYTVTNDRPIAWEGRVSIHADVLDGRRMEVDRVFVDEAVYLDPGESDNREIQTTPRELGFTDPRPEGWRGNAFTLVVQGPGPERFMVFRVAEEGDRSLGR